jgi:hypothetical protein
MSCVSGTNTVNDGLVFSYDMNNTVKSWKGKPTTNYAYNQNPRIDSTYAQWEPTADATWTTNHPGRLIVYNDDGNAITGYINSGVNSGNWTVTHHAYWVYDEELKKPVVIMRDLDAQWKAKRWNTGQSMTSMGLGAGDTYTISWLQWTTNIGKSANAGLYGQNTSGQNGFHDGQSNAQPSTAYNTKPYTWQRVYATFTVNAVRNMEATLSCYMYGQYGGRGVIKISDVQIEPGVVSGFSKAQNRSNTEALLDVSGQENTITADSLTYNNDGSFGIAPNGELIVPHSATLHPTDAYTSEVWLWADSSQDNLYPRVWDKSSILVHLSQTSPFTIAQNTSTSAGLRQVSIGGAFAHSTWTHITTSYNGQVGKIYVNGSEIATTDWGSVLAPSANSTSLGIGGASTSTNRQFNGKISTFRFYNRALTANEVKQNFESTRTQYGV